jgi:hypothetical protein
MFNISNVKQITRVYASMYANCTVFPLKSVTTTIDHYNTWLRMCHSRCVWDVACFPPNAYVSLFANALRSNVHQPCLIAFLQLPRVPSRGIRYCCSRQHRQIVALTKRIIAAVATSASIAPVVV